MALSTMRGTIDRRILTNYRVEAAALDAALPDPFRSRTVDGYGVGGVCFIRLTGMRPAFLPGTVGEAVGMASENAAHRIAVESSYFEDPDRFPPGTVAFDHALLMEDIDHEWRQHEPICAATPAD